MVYRAMLKICILLVLIVATGCGEVHERVKLPLPSEVTSATFESSHSLYAHKPKQPRMLTASKIEMLLAYIAPAELCKKTDWLHMGTVRLSLHDGTITTLDLYDSGQNQIEYEVNSVYCKRKGDIEKIDRISGRTTMFFPHECIALCNALFKE